ncbi:MAG: peptidase family protein [Phycisphaerales bacterium]|nr:peptidase family protein [Phycisphaerales bacterium]
MEPASKAFLYDLLRTPSPTGWEQPIQRKIHDQFKGVAHASEPDVHGNLILSLNPGAKRNVMLAGHCDQIGFLVKYISPEGYIYLDALGGTDSGVVLGEHMVIHTKTGPIEGVMGRKPLHLQMGSEMQQIPTKDKIWLDVGAKDDKQVKERVQIGDYVTFTLRVAELQGDLIASPGLDNKAGLFVCLEALRRCAKDGCKIGLHVASTVQEEIGSRGASTATTRLSPDVGIAVDVIPATDDPGYDLPPQQYVPCKLRHGPTISTGPNTNPVVEHMLLEAARRRDVPFQPDPSGKTAANDARVIQVADSGMVATASVGIPQRNMHTQVEIVSLSDLDHAVELLVEFVRSVKDDTDFRPFYFKG